MLLILQVMSMITQTTAVMTVLMIMESLIESAKTFFERFHDNHNKPR